MGPRRKLTQAISELKEKEKQEEAAKEENKKAASFEEGKTPHKTSRPLLKKQSSTDVTEAYRQVRVHKHVYTHTHTHTHTHNVW